MADYFDGFRALNEGLRFRAQRKAQEQQDLYQQNQDTLTNQYRDRVLDLQDRDFQLRQKAQQATEQWRQKKFELDVDKQLADQSAEFMKLTQRPVAIQPPQFHTQTDPFGNKVTFMRTFRSDGSASDSVYTPKDATEAKALTAEELKRLDAIRQARDNISMMRKFYGLGQVPDASMQDIGGPVAGRWSQLFNYLGWSNPDVVRAQGLATASVPNLARGVFGEVGVLTDADVNRYMSLVPRYTDTAVQREAKLKLLEDYVNAADAGMRATYNEAGRNVGTGASAPTPAQTPRFDSEDEARAAGVSVAELFDPDTGRYRLARIE